MSLQDQLLKAGLINKQKAKQVRTDKRRKRKQNKVDESEVIKAEAAQKRAEAAEQDKALNAVRDAKAEALGRERGFVTEIKRAAIKPGKEAEIGFNYTFNNKVLKLYIDERLQEQLLKGQLGIVRIDNASYLLPGKLVERVQAFKPEWVAYLWDGEVEEQTDEEDPYAGYEIPDDLMW
ncbi:DUF2058 domain-containing protein [Paraferrimonas sedimenticola]|uniref:DUF2058 domain-containing protein n=1 Tax=Paraferrimonas sedimenticola TaxID=375674 RepID=A0AA37W1Q6_9GAMM|nr:DUF2058 domain-containing protein [Paraferrimonas sedimenticola]GLP96612.1 DUF2058 domain-containing protein [Paraferrimonas sedimenticola]